MVALGWALGGPRIEGYILYLKDFVGVGNPQGSRLSMRVSGDCLVHKVGMDEAVKRWGWLTSMYKARQRARSTEINNCVMNLAKILINFFFFFFRGRGGVTCKA